MPALVAFGRRWQIASDDFVFPGFLDVLIRVSWLIAGCVIYWKHEFHLSCDGGYYMKAYLYGNFMVLLAIVFSDIALVQNSMDGYMMDLEARKHVAPCLYLRLLLEIPEIAWNIFGSIWVFDGLIECPGAEDALMLIKVLVAWNWVIILIIIIVIALIFDPMGSGHEFEEGEYDRLESSLLYANTRHTRIWERRCRFLMCSCTVSDQLSRGAFKEVGKIMSFLFEDSDLVASDVAAGLILLNLKLKAEANMLQNQPAAGNVNGLSQEIIVTNEPPPSREFAASMNVSRNNDNDPWNTPHMIAYFMKYSLGCYGWPWYIVAHPSTALCRLWGNILCCGCCVSHSLAVEGDNCCFCHTSALKNTTKLHDQYLLYATFYNELYQTPFFVAVDHSVQSIIISIRGTMSLRDALTDLTAEARSLSFLGLSDSCKAHNGMIRCAQNVLDKLDNLQILDKAFATYPAYTLIINGHSLGAGTATILALMLRVRYPTLRCYAYSPPGALMTLEAAQYCESFTTSVVLGADIVPRLSVPTFERFKTKLVNTIKNCKTPKYRIMVGGCWYLCMGGTPNLDLYDEPLANNQDDHDEQGSDDNLLVEKEPQYAYVSFVEVLHQTQRETVTSCPMYPPGKIYYVTERPIFQSRPDLVDGSRYEFRWADRTEFSDILVAPRMMVDHYPNAVYRALKDVAHANATSPYYSVI